MVFMHISAFLYTKQDHDDRVPPTAWELFKADLTPERIFTKSFLHTTFELRYKSVLLWYLVRCVRTASARMDRFQGGGGVVLG